MPDQPRPVTTGVAARALGVDEATLWRWAQQGQVTPLLRTPGGHLRWDIDQLRRQLAYNQKAAAPQPDAAPEHPPAVVAIVTSALGVLVGRRNDGKPPWTFIAGEIGPSESQADAAVREVKQQTGLVVTAAGHEIGRRVHPETPRTMIYLACSPTEGTDVFVGDTDELAEVRWVWLAEADELLPGMFEPVRVHLAQTLSAQ
jgi:8-oxo-dGTP pyrophosphatase MutT (NUDIX family)